MLIDGRRAQPANSTLVIDMNSIPSSAIDKVEIITGGASATYGADAMGGVTNFKLRDRFEGATVEARGGITEAGDGAETQVSTLFGANLGDGRGNVMLGLEWMQRKQADLFGRPFFENALTDPGAPTTALRLDYSAYEPNASAGGLPSQAAANALFPERVSNVNRSTFFYLNHDNTLFKDVGALGYTGAYGEKFKLQPNGVLGENNLDELVSSPMTRYSLLGRAHYAIAEDTRLIAQTMFATTEVRSLAQAAGANGGFAASIPRDADHPVPAELAALLDSRGPNVYSTTQFDPEHRLSDCAHRRRCQLASRAVRWISSRPDSSRTRAPSSRYCSDSKANCPCGIGPGKPTQPTVNRRPTTAMSASPRWSDIARSFRLRTTVKAFRRPEQGRLKPPALPACRSSNSSTCRRTASTRSPSTPRIAPV